MSQLKLTADGGGGTVSLKGPSSTTGNAAIELTVPGTANGTILTSNSSTGKTLKVFQLCRWSHCDYIKDTIYDQALYVGRIQININDGKKRKFLYFQADYKLKD